MNTGTVKEVFLICPPLTAESNKVKLFKLES